jgi:hypothetical protein
VFGVYICSCTCVSDLLCCLVVRVPGYRSISPAFDSCRYQIFWEIVALKMSPLSLVSITEELLQWKSSGSGCRKSRPTAVGIRYADHRTSSIRKFGPNFADKRNRLVGIFRLRSEATEFSLRVAILDGIGFEAQWNKSEALFEYQI